MAKYIGGPPSDRHCLEARKQAATRQAIHPATRYRMNMQGAFEPEKIVNLLGNSTLRAKAVQHSLRHAARLITFLAPFW
jgi:hypothetical protein